MKNISRSANLKKQILYSYVFKLLAISANFLVIPLMVKYLGKEVYGIWSTLLSIVSWFIMFDIGIGNGLRNKVSEAIAKENLSEAKSYIATAYVAIGTIVFILFLSFLPFSYCISWQRVFNTQLITESELRLAISVMLFFILFNFWLSLVDQVLYGIQKTSLSILNQLLKNLLVLLFTTLLYYTYSGSLLSMIIIYGLSLVAANLIISGYFYSKNQHLIPLLTNYSRKKLKAITSLGINFFVIQVAGIVLFTTDKILITQLFGNNQVTDYDIVFKIFSIPIMAHGMLTAPLWAAYTDAYHRKDYLWLKSTLKKQLKIFLLFVIATIALCFASPTIIRLWIGTEITISNSLILSIALFVLISIWSAIFSTFVNALNLLRLQRTTALIAMCINIPLSIYLAKQFNIGIAAVVLGSCVALSLFAILGCKQVFSFLKKLPT